MPEAVLHDAAVGVLVREWAVYWALIGTVGALPWLARRIFGVLQAPAHYLRARRVAAFGGLLVCLLAFRTVPDTWRMEARYPQRIALAQCWSQAQQGWGWARSVQCADGQRLLLRWLPRLPQHAAVVLAYLPGTRLAVAQLPAQQ